MSAGPQPTSKTLIFPLIVFLSTLSSNTKLMLIVGFQFIIGN